MARRRRGIGRWGVAVLVVLIGVLVGLLLERSEPEPRYAGRSLSQWLHSEDPDFVWIPNDLYGHIHDELWEKLVAQSKPVPTAPEASQATAARPSLARQDQPSLGPEAIPWLVKWMHRRPTELDHTVSRLLPHVPDLIRRWGVRFDDSPWTGRAGRWQVAACEGFQILGPRASNAVPALAPLMAGDGAELPLALALTRLGTAGVSVVVHALDSTNAPARDTAALALGMGENSEALPALLRCVERGQAGYHVLGAIGRIEPNQPAVVAPLVRLMERVAAIPSPDVLGVRAGVELDPMMAALLLGLQGSRASNALPVLMLLHSRCPGRDSGPNPDRRLLRRVIQSIDPATAAHLPAAGNLDDSEDWP